MIHKKTFDFLNQLAINNNKEWFDTNKATYLSIKKEFELFVHDWIECSCEYDPQLKGKLAKDCIFRQNRDVRFSTNKAPYKTNFAAYVSKGGKKWPGAGYYLHIEPEKSFFAAGVWMPEPELLKSIRQEIDYNFSSFCSIVEEKSFLDIFGIMEGEKLQRPPKGYSEDNPAIAYLKHKSFVYTKSFLNEEVFQSDFKESMAHLVKLQKPYIDFLNACL